MAFWVCNLFELILEFHCLLNVEYDAFIFPLVMSLFSHGRCFPLLHQSMKHRVAHYEIPDYCPS